MASIARQYGFRNWRRIYNHSRNAKLRATRESPELLSPGDDVFIPDREPKYVMCETHKLHDFVLSKRPRWLQLRLLDGDKLPHAGGRYALAVGSCTQRRKRLVLGGSCGPPRRHRCV